MKSRRVNLNLIWTGFVAGGSRLNESRFIGSRFNWSKLRSFNERSRFNVEESSKNLVAFSPTVLEVLCEYDDRSIWSRVDAMARYVTIGWTDWFSQFAEEFIAKRIN